jgi:hypothetical protein
MNLYEVRLKVGPGPDSPEGVTGALVCCFSPGEDYRSAVSSAVHEAGLRGIEVHDVQSPVRELPIDRWGEYVSTTWPEFAANFPTQDEIGALVEGKSIFFGPFLGHEG